MAEALIQALGLENRGVVSLTGSGGKTTLMFRLAGELAAQGKRVLTTTTTKILTPGPEQSPATLVVPDTAALIEKLKTRTAAPGHVTVAKAYQPATGKLIGFGPETIRKLWQTGWFDWIIVEADGARRLPLKAWGPHEPVLPKVTTHLVVVAGLDGPGRALDDKNVFRPEIYARICALPLKAAISTQAVAKVLGVGIRAMSATLPQCRMAVVLNKADTAKRLAAGMHLAGLIEAGGLKPVDRVVITALNDAVPVKKKLLFPSSKPDTPVSSGTSTPPRPTGAVGFPRRRG